MKNLFRTLPVLALLLIIAAPHAYAGLSEGCYPAVECTGTDDYYVSSCQNHIESTNGATPSCQSLFGAPTAGYSWTFSCTGGCVQSLVPLCSTSIANTSSALPCCADGQVAIKDAASASGWKCGTNVGLWTTDGTNVWRPAGLVGIGTATPGAGLHVKGNGWSSSFLFLDTIKPFGTAGGLADAGIRFENNGVVQFHLYNQGEIDTLHIDPDGKTGIAITKAGKVGIGTTTPVALLNVETSTGGAASIGFGSTATGNSSVAIGYASQATGPQAIVLGSWSSASGDNSVAIGDGASAGAQYSIALGDSSATGDATIAMGNSATAQAYHSVVMGKYNKLIGNKTTWVATDPLFVIGNGTSTAADDAFVVYKNGALASGNGNYTLSGVLPAANAVALGQYNDATGSGSVALGVLNTSTKNASVAFGQGNDAVANYAVAMGYVSYAAGSSSVAMGYGSDTSGASAIAMGSNSHGDGDSSVAMGYNSTASGKYSTAMGDTSTAEPLGSTAMSGGQAIGNHLSSKTTWYADDPVFVLGDGNTYVSNNELLRILKNGTTYLDGPLYLGPSNTWSFNTRSDNGDLEVVSSVGGWAKRAWLQQANGQWAYASDARLKNVHSNFTAGLNAITELQPVNFTWKSDDQNASMQVGLIAQNVQKVLPEAVTIGNDSENSLGINPNVITVTLVNAIKELKAENDELKTVVCEIKPDAKVCAQ